MSWPSLPRNIRVVVLMIAAQAVCLCFGLWMQDQFMVASAKWQAAQELSIEPQRTTDGGTSESETHQELTAEGLLSAMSGSRLLGFVWICGLQSIVAYLVLTRMNVEHEQREMQSHEENLLRAKELVRTRDAVIFGLAKLAESRDPDTGHHLERIAMYATRLASALRRHSRYRKVITPAFVRTIGISSALHDIGKVGVEDAVLLKPGKLNENERFRMQVHTTLGGECIRQIEQRLGNSNFLEMAREIAFCHHERWDGEGYPVGLIEEEIPLSARIVAIADVYDALASRRVYKEPYPHEKCVEIIKAESGKQFDPRLIEVFLSIHEQFHDISRKFAEPYAEFVSPTNAADEDAASVDIDKLTSEQELLLTQTIEQASASLSLSDRQFQSEQEHVRSASVLADSSVD
ncbi:MAG: HD domain-containing protein [Planctomycetaceae bacterium]|nr:HD domain-containing protein [Planctomycetaceae bacterium]